MGKLILDKYEKWKAECEQRFLQLKANEDELNRIFIDIYGLQDELTPEVADKDITVHRIFDTKDEVPESMQGSSYVRTKRDEVVSLLSYAWAVCSGDTRWTDRGLFLPEAILILYIGNSKDKLLLMNRAIRLTADMLEYHWRIITTPNSMIQKNGKMQLRFPMSRMLMVLSPSPTKSIWKTILSPACVAG